MPVEAPFQGSMVPVNDDKIIGVATEQAAVDAEMADISGLDPVNENIDIIGVDPLNNKTQHPR